MDWGQIFNQSASSIISTTTIAYALAALGLGVHFGQAGLLNMGVAGFMLDLKSTRLNYSHR